MRCEFLKQQELEVLVNKTLMEDELLITSINMFDRTIDLDDLRTIRQQFTYKLLAKT